jgi:predicted phosphoribosyltransferase
MIFRDRTQASELLADRLKEYRAENPLVLAIPRGAVPMARLIADRLHGELDVVLVHKTGAPGNPEFAIGSVSEFGTVYRSDAVESYHIPKEFIEAAEAREIAKLRMRRASYSPVRPPVSPQGRLVIIVDDGIATGSTMLAAVRAMRDQAPERVIVASPVASMDATIALRQEADEVVVLDIPASFYAISEFYESFPQVSDEEVLQTLSRASPSQPAEQRAM